MTGCENSVEPIIGTDLPFTLWGYMNAGADTQRVRVFPITGEILPDGSQGLDARVFSTDLTTGERREWTYKAVAFDSLVTGHVFWSPFRAEHERQYRLEVVRSDGVTSHVETTVPLPVTIEVEVDSNKVVVPVRINVDREAANIIALSATYHAHNLPPMNILPIGTQIHPPVYLPVTVSYLDQLRPAGDHWEVTIDMEQDFEIVQRAFQANCAITRPGGSAPYIWLRRVEFRALVVDTAWVPPGGVFDPDILAVPGTFSNIENGYGFFGALQDVRYLWTPSLDARYTAGYYNETQCRFFSEGPECMDPPIPCLQEDVPNFWDVWLF